MTTGPGATLAAMLRKAGHRVIQPADANLVGASDAKHLEYAIGSSLVVLTADRRDFWDLHDLVLTSGDHHGGIFLVRYDNDRTRDMKPHHIVRAVGRVERSGIPVADQVIILNHWR